MIHIKDNEMLGWEDDLEVFSYVATTAVALCIKLLDIALIFLKFAIIREHLRLLPVVDNERLEGVVRFLGFICL